MLSSKIYKKWMAETQRAKLKGIIGKVKPEGKILDVGAGPGFLEEFLPEAVAADVDLENLRLVGGLKVLADGNALPFKNGVFDFVFCIDTLHLLKKTEEMARVCKRRGKLIAGLFCNENNCKEIAEKLERYFRGKPKEKFLVKTKKEWDTVLVMQRAPGA